MSSLLNNEPWELSEEVLVEAEAEESEEAEPEEEEPEESFVFI